MASILFSESHNRKSFLHFFFIPWIIFGPFKVHITPEENALIEIKLALSRSLKQRGQQVMTQAELAGKIQSSQPRIAKAENGDASVSIELLIRAILATGATPKEIGQVIAEVG
ncbi:MAG TPA: transcriptional regulator [Cyanobacteria bacterium UBA11369]|nr:transcriptional regulator [Cyanobacteria bacterium UBA11371]HBE32682.1 transcriptional regulator [Cyanobacteria bacterium UBA11368]HBE48204.1 transcriptional regulator [Cyanobacteria bacterium UBA11369]